MDRSKLKMDARQTMAIANPHPVLFTLVYLAIVFVAQSLLGTISSLIAVIPGLFYNSGAYDVISFGMLIPSVIIMFLLILIQSTLQMGYTAYSMKVINRQLTGMNDLFAYIRQCLKITGLTFVIGIFVLLWSLLLYIPGIIAAYRYSMAYYIMAEDPTKSVMQCINESKIMMEGYKMEKFILDLSFILWGLLVLVTCGIAGLYVTPYVSVTNAAFFYTVKAMRGGYWQQGPNTGEQPQNFGPQDYQQQSYAQQGYQQQPYSQPGYQQQPYSQPGYQQQPYSQPNDQQQSYGQPPFAQPGYEQPPFTQQGYGQPPYSQPDNQQQGYGQPPFAQQDSGYQSFGSQTSGPQFSGQQPADHQSGGQQQDSQMSSGQTDRQD